MRGLSIIQSVLISAAFLIMLVSCRNEVIQKPIMLGESPVLSVPFNRLEFSSEEKNWAARLYSFGQPIPLKIQYTETGFYLSQKNQSGVIQGPGIIYLRAGSNDYFYDVSLVNKENPGTILSDYRSPKTVNPDSSLTHQKLFIAIDHWRNVVPSNQTAGYFEEKEISVPPITGVYRAQVKDPLSSYYVQPGSCTSIPLQAEFNTDRSTFHVVAGPLKDAYDNQVADGTVVAFMYEDGVYSYRMEATVHNGSSTVDIPVKANHTYTLVAAVNETKSLEIQLNP
jgi:hypothetical protein